MPWHAIDALFIGGTTAWKLGPDAAHLAGQARRRGLWVHMGRVNSLWRLRHATAIDAHRGEQVSDSYRPDSLPPTTGASARRASHNPRQQDNLTWPVVTVRPATTHLATTTVAQRQRRRAASQLAAGLTNAARADRPGFFPVLVLTAPVDEIPQAATIIDEAVQLVAAPPPAALQVGRNLRGDPVAVALHSDRWSLVIETHPAAARQPAVSYAFIDGSGGQVLALCFDDQCTALGVAWDEMTHHVLAMTT
ncbi:hypothetical protein [Micromonospora sp. WMMD980]|uniref:hypothetical protein n=1 Tax=Micromonospora sp. WMMD980 TaxID=3016088 RepID=UPI002415FEC0|nr:hypothetical protein [Micromonospora sp. WMMD980]MDG4803681.1 hypothetical protein [Micromonospora sp. WMMD980]